MNIEDTTMSFYKLIIILTIAANIFHLADTAYCQQKIWNNLKPTYNAETSPSDQHTTLNVSIGMMMLEFITLDEPRESLITAWLATAFWKDTRLSWNSSQAGFDNCERMRLPAKSVYLPDIRITNVHGLTQIFGLDSRVNVDSNGQISWFTLGAVTSGCTIDLTYYPFDYQTCFINIQSISEKSLDIQLWPHVESINFDYFRKNSVWDIVDSKIVRTKFLESDVLKFYIRLRRKPLYYIFNIAAPVIILSAMTLLVFCMPAEAGEKMGYVVTVFLSYTVFTAQISESVPESSEAAPLLGEFTALSFIYSALAIVATASVMSLFHTPANEKPSFIIMLLVQLVDCSFFFSRSHWKRERKASVTESAESSALASDGAKKYDGTTAASFNDDIDNSQKNKSEGSETLMNYWQRMALKLDSFYFWLFLSLNFLTIIFCLVIVPYTYRSNAADESWGPSVGASD